jgi:polygalacturonase
VILLFPRHLLPSGMQEIFPGEAQMKNSRAEAVSRRQCLQQLSLSGVAASLGATMMTAEGPATRESGTSDLGARIYNVRDFGGKGDGTSLDTAAVQAAIDACHKDRGGTVLVPAGIFVIGTIELKSNVTLHLAAQGKLLGSADGKQYRAVDAIPLSGDSTLGDGNVALICAVNAENILVEGLGTIDGQGAQFHSPSRDILPPAGIRGNQRPYQLLFHRCQNLIVRDIFLKASAYHSVRIIQSSYIKLEGLRIHSRVNGNNDGFHFVSSQHIHISNCTVECQDDACALFGSCKFVTVTNCTFSTRWSVFRFGGGEAENITVSNCIIYDTFGCPIKIRGGRQSRMENMVFSNLIMKNVTGPISIGLDSSSRRSSESAAEPAAKGVVRNISFQGIRATVVSGRQLEDLPIPSTFRPGESKSCIVLNGVGNDILEEISFNNVHITYEGGGTAEDASVREVAQRAGEYFELGVLPAYGMYARNVRGLTLHDVRFEVAAPDLRPALVFDQVMDSAIHGFSAQANPAAESLLRFVNTRDVLLASARVLTPAAAFMQVEGENNERITIDGGDLSRAAIPVRFIRGAREEAVRLRV